MQILAEYDPDFTSFSLDEAYFDLTDYCINKYRSECQVSDDILIDTKVLPEVLWNFAEQGVKEIRDKIYAKTGLTASAGISCNAMIAKICTDINKPNGQFMVQGTLQKVKAFIEETPVRKICGIGPIREQVLAALQINTCKDLWIKRDIIQFLFTPFTARYYMKIALGIGSTIIRNDESRKSKSIERTFGEISDVHEIHDKLYEMSCKLADDLLSEDLKCKTVTIKLKRVSFEISLKSHSLSSYTSDPKALFEVAKTLFKNELLANPKKAKFRLIGLKVSNFCNYSTSPSQMTLSGMFKAQNEKNKELVVSETDSTKGSLEPSTDDYCGSSLCDSDNYECSVCGEIFAHKFLFECHENDCIDRALDISTNGDLNEIQSAPQTLSCNNTESDAEERIMSLCPVCNANIGLKSNEELNLHLDICLSRDVCFELTQVPLDSSSPPKRSTPLNESQKRLNSDTKTARHEKIRKSLADNKSKSKSDSSQKRIDSYFHSSR